MSCFGGTFLPVPRTFLELSSCLRPESRQSGLPLAFTPFGLKIYCFGVSCHKTSCFVLYAWCIVSALFVKADLNLWTKPTIRKIIRYLFHTYFVSLDARFPNGFFKAQYPETVVHSSFFKLNLSALNIVPDCFLFVI